MTTVTGRTRAAKKDVLAGQTGAGTAAAYAADADQEAIPENSLPALQAMAEELLNCERDVAGRMADLKRAIEALADVQERRLPNMMEKFGLPFFHFVDKTTGKTLKIKLNTGWRVAMPPLKDDDGNYIPENDAKRKHIFGWFREIGLGAIIKKDMTVPMGLVTDDFAAAVMAELKTAHPDLDPGLSEKIEPMTLKAQVRRLKEAGKSIHEDIICNPVRKAEVK